MVYFGQHSNLVIKTIRRQRRERGGTGTEQRGRAVTTFITRAHPPLLAIKAWLADGSDYHPRIQKHREG